MLDAIVATIREIIDFRKKAREDKKIGLEIEKLQDEQQRRENLIHLASFDDVKRFDPKFRDLVFDITEMAERKHAKPQPWFRRSPLRGALIFLIAFIVTVLLAALIWHFMR
jgi:hypothetical protein